MKDVSSLLARNCILHDSSSAFFPLQQLFTCSDSLPANRKRGSGLHHVHGDRTVVVRSRAPGQLHGSISNISHQRALGGPGRSCNSKKHKETLALASLHNKNSIKEIVSGKLPALLHETPPQELRDS